MNGLPVHDSHDQPVSFSKAGFREVKEPSATARLKITSGDACTRLR